MREAKYRALPGTERDRSKVLERGRKPCAEGLAPERGIPTEPHLFEPLNILPFYYIGGFKSFTQQDIPLFYQAIQLALRTVVEMDGNKDCLLLKSR